jgi:hypothetical protein
MAYRSRRANILANLQRQLETITTDNGYTSSVQKVTTSVKNWNDTAEAECPVLYLVDENTQYTYHAGKKTERTWTVSIYGVMKNKSQMEMEELIADIEEALMKNQTLTFEDYNPGPLAYIRIQNIVTDNQLFSEIEGSQLFKITLLLSYTACVDQVR